MKKLVSLALLMAFSVLATGCGSTPAYSSRERSRLIGRNWGIQARQINDDVDSFMLQRGGGWLSIWNVKPSR